MEFDPGEVRRCRVRAARPLEVWQRTRTLVLSGNADGMGAFTPPRHLDPQIAEAVADQMRCMAQAGAPERRLGFVT